MRAAVIRSASPSSRDKGDPHYCFRSLDSMKLRSWPVVWALIVCRLVLGVFLTSSVLWIALEISSCHCKGISHKTLWSSTFYAIASDQLFEPCSFAGRSQEWFALFLARTRGRNFLLCSICLFFLHEVFLARSLCSNFQLPSNEISSCRQDSPFGLEKWIMIACMGVNQSFWVSNSW